MSDDFNPERMAWVLTDADLDYLHLAIEECEEVVLDLETTGLDEHAAGQPHRNGGVPARIVLASLTLPKPDEDDPTTWVVPLSHPDSPFLGHWVAVMRRIAIAIKANGKPLTNQNVKFDCRWVKAHTGVDLSPLISWDTRISAHLLDENSSTSLKSWAPRTFDVRAWNDFDLSTPGAAEAVPMFDLGAYAARDTYWTWRGARLHREILFNDAGRDAPATPDEVENARLGALAAWCAMPTTATLTAIEQRGIALDEEWTKAERETHRAEVGRLTVSLASLYVLEEPDRDISFAPTSHYFRDWSEAAVRAGDLSITAMTPTGRPKWNKSVLMRQARAGAEVAVDLLALRSHTKKVEYLTSWLGCVTAQGLIHTTYNQGSVTTGRLSSSTPNLQQVTAVLKPAFLPSPGYVFADLDYGQIEMRVAAFISRCEPMIEAFRRGDDLHAILAQQITGRTEITPEERQHGKAGNFGFLFGMGPYGFREYAEDVYGVSFTIDEAELIHRTFFSTWDGLAAWHMKAVATAQRTGQIVSPIGRVRRLPDIWSNNEQRAMGAERVAINSPVQGFASDIMQIAAASIEGRIIGTSPVADAATVATVHDSILVEVPEDNWKEVTLACQERMLGVCDVLRHMDCDFDVPLEVTAKVGTRWGLADVATLA